MRIAGTSYTDSLVTQLNYLTSQQFQLQGQISTGQRIQRPEDDPAGMSQALSLQADSSSAAQYAQNISTLQTSATTASNALQQLKTISDRAGEIATLADGTKTPQQLQTYATEVNQLIQEAVQVANQKNGDQYIFAGTKTDAPPFTATTDANGIVTGVTYQGNTTVSQSEIAQGTTVSVGAPGENNSGSGPRGLIADNRYGADFFNHLISLQKDLSSGNTSAIAKSDAPALGKDEDNLIYHIANNGLVQSRLEAGSTTIDNIATADQQSLTKVAGVNMTLAITQLSRAQGTYQAALQSSSVLLQMQQQVMQYL
ncbi:MAG TPA: flagellar hook-associated protein FlgL [Verrucomicrobiae bacterium]|nr:flagellar hook-associated protein FlgL [Verrucomicrobiae bacterium]